MFGTPDDVQLCWKTFNRQSPNLCKSFEERATSALFHFSFCSSSNVSIFRHLNTTLICSTCQCALGWSLKFLSPHKDKAQCKKGDSLSPQPTHIAPLLLSKFYVHRRLAEAPKCTKDNARSLCRPSTNTWDR
uniref:Uncharacterized protein n=1 Tax=Nothoprocta perdicaria TaxID=30464 RepID=A0A8C6Z336_NOTPE